MIKIWVIWKNQQLKIIKLLDTFSIDEVEASLVSFYVHSNNITIEKNQLIKELLFSSNNDIIAILKTHQQNIKINDLVNYFEILIPKNDKKINGAFFTPKLITKFIIDEIFKDKEYDKKYKVCDPSCGCGAFLVQYAKSLKENYDIPIIRIIENNLFGVDIAEYSIKRAKIILSLFSIRT